MRPTTAPTITPVLLLASGSELSWSEVTSVGEEDGEVGVCEGEPVVRGGWGWSRVGAEVMAEGEMKVMEGDGVGCGVRVREPLTVIVVWEV